MMRTMTLASFVLAFPLAGLAQEIQPKEVKPLLQAFDQLESRTLHPDVLASEMDPDAMGEEGPVDANPDEAELVNSALDAARRAAAYLETNDITVQSLSSDVDELLRSVVTKLEQLQPKDVFASPEAPIRDEPEPGRAADDTSIVVPSNPVAAQDLSATDTPSTAVGREDVVASEQVDTPSVDRVADLEARVDRLEVSLVIERPNPDKHPE